MEPDEVYPLGWDYAWLAADAAGHVAIFTNAGQGPIPIAVLADRRASDHAERLVEALPERSDCQMLVALPRPDDFIAYARRGLFAYDWQDCHRDTGWSHRYELLARPTAPVLVEELPGEVVALIGRVWFQSLRFAESMAIAVDDHVESRRA
ncbi:MAG: hypothetical protein P4L85_08030 [Paludisphaera borealis]|uniref:hypothetical protein n=1 Tax=Paludisphaera borealis TaxID=1387353 RepID=UPI0028477644|nr:hypothetical protein [Paludisphaera borealis]MDR3619283.1 hypothetical protein [Paludisphaera borealis]